MTDLIPSLLPWHKDVWRRLASTVERGQLAHGTLLSGPRGVGKQLLARRLLNLAICADPIYGAEPTPCGLCRSCQLWSVGTHPGAWVVRPAESSTSISIEQIRDVVAKVGLTTQVGHSKAVLVAPAEAMTLPAANALLKTLEEPPGASYFVLVSHNPSSLPRTIRSRCLGVTVPCPSQEVAADWLGASEAEAVALLPDVDNAPFEALRLAEEGHGTSIPTVKALLVALVRGQREPVAAAAELRQIGDAELVVDTMYRTAHNLVRLATLGPSTLSNDDATVLTPIANGIESQAVFALTDRLREARADLRSAISLNEQLLLEDLSVRWGKLAR